MVPPKPGELFEQRVARLLHAEGAFVRRRVGLDQQVGGRQQVTDLDVLAFAFDETLALRRTTGECKTAEGRNAPSAKDRLLWLAGVNHLVGTDSGFLATMRGVRDIDRRFAHSLGLEVVDIHDLERRELVQGLTEDSGPALYSAGALLLEREVEVAATKDNDLRRVWTFVRGELWLSEPVAALKRAMGASRVLASRWSPELGAGDKRVVRWLASETIVGLVLSLTRLAGESYRSPEQVFSRHLNERLAEGLASFEAMRQIAAEVDRFLVGALREAGVDDNLMVGAIGALAPRPPAYAEPLLELIQRLALEPRLARELPRLAELYLGEHQVGGKIEGPEHEAARLLRLVAAFLERQARLPAELIEPLRQRASFQSSGDEAVVSRPDAGGNETGSVGTAESGDVTVADKALDDSGLAPEQPTYPDEEGEPGSEPPDATQLRM